MEVPVLRVFVLTACVALLVLPQLASALPPAALPPSSRQPAASILLVQAKPDPAVADPTIAWAQARLAEIDAAITTLDAATRALAAEARKRTDEVIDKLRTTRDAFHARIDAIVADGKQKSEAQLAEARAALDAQWSEFERQLDGYFATASAEIALRSAVLQAREKAEEQYWQQAIATLKTEEQTVVAEQRPAIDAAIAALQSYADAAKTRLAKIQQAGSDAWSALADSLADARRAFDKAYAGVEAAIERARQ
jgi:hypothetical protein